MSYCYQQVSCPTCPILLDASCVKYHLFNLDKTQLKNLGISNKATLELILETIDDKIQTLDVTGFDLPCLREGHVVNTSQQLLEAVDEEICELLARVPPIENENYSGVFDVDPAAYDGTFWWRSDLLELRGYYNGAVYTITTTPA